MLCRPSLVKFPRSAHLHFHVGRGIRRINPKRNSLRQINLPQLFLFELALLIANAQTRFYFFVIYPCAFNNSAQSTAPPAAPRTVLWDNPTNFQSYTESSLIRPTDTPIPFRNQHPDEPEGDYPLPDTE